MKTRTWTVAGLTVAALITGIAAAETDTGFMAAAWQGGMAEVEMGRLAVQHASDDRVKQFGQRMIDDHTKANNQLKQLAAKKGVTLPTQVNAKQKSTIDKLSQMSGAEFDRAYMRDMVKDHQEDVAEFERESNHGSDADVKTFATNVLPTLQEHLRLAESTMGQLTK